MTDKFSLLGFTRQLLTTPAWEGDSLPALLIISYKSLASLEIILSVYAFNKPSQAYSLQEFGESAV